MSTKESFTFRKGREKITQCKYSRWTKCTANFSFSYQARALLVSLPFINCSVNTPIVIMSPNIAFTQSTELRGGDNPPQQTAWNIWRNNKSFANTPFTRGEEERKCPIKVTGLRGASQMFGRSSDYWDRHNPGTVESMQDMDLAAGSMRECRRGMSES